MGKRQRRRAREQRQNPVLIAEVPFDSSVWLKHGTPTYGGKPMPNLLPTADEYFAALEDRKNTNPAE